MLKGISPVISPEFIMILMEMGHGDEPVVADGLGCPVLSEAILSIFPLDPYVEKPVALTSVVPGNPYQPVIREEYRTIVRKHESGFKDFD